MQRLLKSNVFVGRSGVLKHGHLYQETEPKIGKVDRLQKKLRLLSKRIKSKNLADHRKNKSPSQIGNR